VYWKANKSKFWGGVAEKVLFFRTFFKKMTKKHEKDLQDKKHCVSLQPVSEETRSSLKILREITR